jgi:hypothetical protein
MNSTNQPNKERPFFQFAAIDRYVEDYVVKPKETLLSGKDMVEWGTKNAYPDYLLDLYNSVPTLRSIINGNIDYVVGDDITFNPAIGTGVMNGRGDTITDQVRDLAMDFWIYGGFALQVIRDITGGIAEVYYLDVRFLRSNKEGDVFYYCEKWNKGGRNNVIIYPAFNPNLDWASLTDEERDRNASSILYVKNTHTQVYPAPMYAAAVKDCEIERLITDFHISDINNHFVSSAIINFNNGQPSQEQQEEVEDEVNEKFCGATNGGRVMLSWNPNKESATDIVEFKVEDFGERYKALSQHSRQQIYCSFRAVPLLFGLTSEANTGFSTEEFEQSFKLYNRTQIRPVQRKICDAYDKIYGVKGVITIKPFSLEEDEETNVN